MNKKYILGGIVIVVIGIALWSSRATAPSTDHSPQELPLAIGAILPLSGNGSHWGEDIRDGMLLSIDHVLQEGHDIEVLFEDSAANPTTGLSAYRSLQSKNLDLVVSAFSRVTVPLIDVVDADEVPMIMTLVGAQHAAASSPYAFRHFSNAHAYATNHIDTTIKNREYKNIAVLHINDEYGASLHDSLVEAVTPLGISVVANEAFAPGTTDFRTALTKIQAKNPDAIFITPIVPPEAIALVKQIRELGMTADIIDASAALTVPSTKEALGDALEGVYSSAYLSTLEPNDQFVSEYHARYDKDPSYASVLGYDIVNIAAAAKNDDSRPLRDALASLRDMNTLNGVFSTSDTGEMSPILIPVVYRDGDFVSVR